MTRRLLMATLLFGLILLVACGKSDDVEQDEPSENNQVSESTDEKEQETDDQVDRDSEKSDDETMTHTDSDSSTGDTTKDESTKDSTDQNDNQPEVEIIKTGSYNGQADPHTIEVETDEGPVAYQLTMEARDMVVDLNPGDQVTYTYYQDGEMLVIKHIEVVN